MNDNNQNRIEDAVKLFKDGFSCSQAILGSFAPSLGLDQTTALRISSVFGGGVAKQAETCGAVSGALMTISLKYGRVKADDTQARDKTYQLAQEFIRLFKERHNSVVCKELLGDHLGTPEGNQRIKDKDLFNTLCPQLIRDAAEILEKLLEN